MLTGMQVRMALAALNWTREDLAQRAGSSRRTIQRLTEIDAIPERMTVAKMSAIRAALEAGGVQFVADGVIFRPGGAQA